MDDNERQQLEIRKRALDLLARREHAPVELKRKLLQRHYADNDIAVVLDALVADNLLSAGRYAESLVHARIARGMGPLRIRADLTRMQIDQKIMDEALAEARADWFELAAAVRRKRFGNDLPDDYKQRAKQKRFLQQRGFDFDCIRAAVDDE